MLLVDPMKEAVSSYVPAGTLITNETYWVTLDSQVPDETPTGQESLTTPDVSTKPGDIPDGTSGSSQNANKVTKGDGRKSRKTKNK